MLNQIKSQKKGQNLENVVSQCRKELDWDRPKALQAIELATTEGLITQIGKEKEQISLRILDKGHQLLNESFNPKTYIPDEQEMNRACSCSLGSDYLEFKRHMFGEVLSLKELIANKTKSVSEDNCGGAINCEQNYIRSLQKRIYSLERKLEQKQSIIEKLLDVNEIRDRSHNRYEIPMGEEPPQHRHTSTQKSKESWNVEHPEVDLKKGKQKSFGKACTTVPDNRQHKRTKNKKKVKESINSTFDSNHDDMATVNRKIKITFVGDSLLRFLNRKDAEQSPHSKQRF